jgi:hypothetical protein
MEQIGAMGCNAAALVDSMALRRLSSAESQAVVEGVKRTLLLFHVSAPRIVQSDSKVRTYLGERAWGSGAIGQLLNGCRSIGPYALRGGLNLGATRLPATVAGGNTTRTASGCRTRGDSVTPEGSMPRNR